MEMMRTQIESLRERMRERERERENERENEHEGMKGFAEMGGLLIIVFGP